MSYKLKVDCAHDDMVDIHKLVPHPRNNNRHSVEQINQLSKIIDYQGMRSPIVVSKLSGFITKGHGRLMACEKLQATKVPVNYQDYENEAQEYADITADNQIAAQAEFDWQAHHITMEEIDFDEVENWDEDFFGIDKSPSQKETVPEEDEKDNQVPGLRENPISRNGDLWLLGEHRLLCGDSTSKENLDILLNGAKAELVFTDPPYRMQAGGGSDQMVGVAQRKLGAAIEHLCDFDPNLFLENIPRAFKKGVMNSYVFCNKDLVPDYLNWAIRNGYAFNILFWKKPNAIPLGGSHRPDVEYLLLFRKSAVWNNGVEGASYSRCLEFGRDKSTPHPTMKPIGLITNELLISSNQGGLVVDFFLGSGSTLIAAEKVGRKCYGFEMDEKYCDVIIERYQQYTGKEVILESSGETYNSLRGKDE